MKAFIDKREEWIPGYLIYTRIWFHIQYNVHTIYRHPAALFAGFIIHNVEDAEEE